jgi:hypothetical protein
MEPRFEDMKNAIEKAGGLFYQYRPCRRDVATIYDIENIRHGVVYAQTPLNMNDPFDSMIGYSPEKIYENCIVMLMDAVKIDDENTKIILEQMLKFKALGKVAELLCNLNDLKKYIFTRQVIMHQAKIPITIFIQQNLKELYSKCPYSIKRIFSREVFLLFAQIVSQMDKVDITEQMLKDIFHMDDLLEELHNKAIEIKDTVYVPHIKKFLSQLTVSCFSISGWDNQLMWSHYANSYSGICIEYDFTKIEQFIGFFYPVEYVVQRQTLSLNDIGIKGIALDVDTSTDYGEPDMEAIFKYLLAKNKCWEYEKEWRIINSGEENKSMFVDFPYVKSITFGLNIDPICKHLMCDMCQEKEIECYEIVIDTEDFSLSRKQLTQEDFSYDMEVETEYINMLFQQMNNMSERMDKRGAEFTDNGANSDFTLLKPMFFDALDMLANAYFLKVSLNRLCDNSEEDLSQADIPEEIIEMIKQLEMFISQIKVTTGSLNETLPSLHFGGALSASDYQIVKKQLCDLKELVEKFEKIDWNPIYIREEAQ